MGAATWHCSDTGCSERSQRDEQTTVKTQEEPMSGMDTHHGFLDQYPELFADDIVEFLNR